MSILSFFLLFLFLCTFPFPCSLFTLLTIAVRLPLSGHIDHIRIFQQDWEGESVLSVQMWMEWFLECKIERRDYENWMTVHLENLVEELRWNLTGNEKKPRLEIPALGMEMNSVQSVQSSSVKDVINLTLGSTRRCVILNEY
ncbi:hypothetical protein BT96DRAFT_975906 [Gymnopus androsaceus JB14]|uniref:Uncharacterized protein n=1 Tax=Gymnopus androsaceus JB14 TaxID=1447944 RepID=A0A6A4HMS3_9AGAR|nr:hypothetical protein BT96DRAFT_975906 [Gymnopus androsaceus JB14]